jgi:aryl sulfotransferase
LIDMNPSRTRMYEGMVSNSARWDGFVPRDDDVFICTPPKSGTTWTQAICAFLIFGRVDGDIAPGMLSPWLDATTTPVDEVYAMLTAQTHRRFIKTHTPLDGVPYFPQCTYLTVYRDPRDTYFSMRNHAANMTSEKLIDRVAGDVGDVFREWAEKPFTPENFDGFALGANVHHFLSYNRFADLPNVHFFHYADMQRDLPGAVAGMAAALGLTPNGALLNDIVSAVSFDNMKGNAGQFAPNAGRGVWKDNSQFFSTGESQQWRDVLSGDDLAIYDARIADLLSADQIDWLHNGVGSS